MIQSNSYSWYKLFSIKGIGSKTIHKIHMVLKAQSQDISHLFSLTDSELTSQFQLNPKAIQGLRFLDEDRCYKEFELLNENEINIIHLDHPNYPTKLIQRLSDSAPPILFCKGVIHFLESRSISIVGSRNVSEIGTSFVKTVVKDLAHSGFNVISGYAKGVDTIAHLSAIENEGTTTFVLSYGILEFSLKKDFRHLPWHNNILAVSQFHPKEKWQASNAMLRNKLVVSFADAVIVVESGPKVDPEGKMSGTFDAGENALKHHVPLFVLSPKSFPSGAIGNQKLIEQGGVELSQKSALETILSYLNNGEKTQTVSHPQQELFG